MNPAMHLTRDLVDLVGWELRVCPLPSAEVVQRTQMQPSRHVLPTDILQGSGDRNRALRAWKRSRRQQAATLYQAHRTVPAIEMVASSLRPTESERYSATNTRNGRHYGETKRRR